MSATPVKHLSWVLPAAVAVALAGLSSPAHSEDLTQIVVRGSNTHTVGYDPHGLRPIQQSTVTIGVRYDPVTLTTNSGVALLERAVTKAAYAACQADDGSSYLYNSCVRPAIDQAQPQIARAVQEARNRLNG
jgi:UrcA family protein